MILFQNPGNGGGSAACDTPNPPFWCDNAEPVAASIESGLFPIIILLLIKIYIYRQWKQAN